MAKIYMIKILESEMISRDYCEKHFPKRMEKASKFRFDDDKIRSYGAGALLSYALNTDEDKIQYTENGKPYIENSNCFSISHSGEYSVLAVSERNIGVDIELCNCKHLKVAERVFSDDEIKYMNENPEKNFGELWTMKESVAKATGLGLSIGFSTFSVLPLIRGESISVNGQTFFGKTMSFDGYTLSYVTENRAEEFEIINTDHTMFWS